MISPAYGVAPSENDLRLLGLICVSWSQLEFLIELSLYHLMRVPHLSAELPRDITKKLVKLKTLSETTIAEKILRKQLIELCDRATQAALRRNLAVHGNWATDVTSKLPAAVSWYMVKEGEPLNVLPASDLSALSDEIATLTHLAKQFLEIRGVLPKP